MKDSPKPRRGASLLGLSLETGRVEAAVFQRTNGSVALLKTLSAPLPSSLLLGPPEALGRELRRLLDEAGIKERRCALALPAAWTLTLQVSLPDLPEPDLASLLLLEAERGFPQAPDALVIAESRYRTDTGNFATLIAFPRERIARLESALAAAQLVPVTFNLGLPELVAVAAPETTDTLVLRPELENVGLLVASGGGFPVLRDIPSVFDSSGDRPPLDADLLRRELRITLAQLPDAVRTSLRRVLVLGNDAAADALCGALAPMVAGFGLTLERLRALPTEVARVVVPAGVAPGTAAAVALRRQIGDAPAFEYLPPRISAWQRFSSRYSSGRMAGAGLVAGAVAVLVALAFLVQQVQLWHWNGRWQAIAKRVGEVESVQNKIRKYRPWFDESVRSLGVLRRLTEAFPEDGSVSAKSIELRAPSTIICTGVARDRGSLLRMLEKLRAAPEVGEMKLENDRGRSPVEFTFNFQWTDRSAP